MQQKIYQQKNKEHANSAGAPYRETVRNLELVKKKTRSDTTTTVDTSSRVFPAVSAATTGLKSPHRERYTDAWRSEVWD